MTVAHPLVEQLRFTRAEWERALLDERRLPEYVGDLEAMAAYRPDR